ncbi:MAG: hypothetical protein FWD01_02140 [Defluviitaleaceae bacterium]|nr:hypothetical protein [Defluviitaleaceae bacterium]
MFRTIKLHKTLTFCLIAVLIAVLSACSNTHASPSNNAIESSREIAQVSVEPAQPAASVEPAEPVEIFEHEDYEGSSDSEEFEEKEERIGLALIAHAGGGIDGYPGSNSLEAMQNSGALGFRYIELDMLPTTDGKILLNHDWNTISNRIPGIFNGNMSHSDFMNHRIFGKFTPVDLDMLIEFLKENPAVRIITDTKDTNYAALYAIAEFFPEYRHRFIPQIYAFGDISLVRDLGFDDIILTVYMLGRANQNPQTIHRFALEEGLYGVTIPESLAFSSFISDLDMEEVRYMTHTIDSPERALEAYSMGFYAIYTGFLGYSDSHPDGIAPISLPLVREYAEQVELNIQKLNAEQRDLISSAILYKMGLPVYADRGEIVPIWSFDWTSTIFESPLSGLIYLPTQHFAEFHERNWIPSENVLHMTVGGNRHVVSRSATHELFLYRDILYISETVVQNILGFDVFRKDDYVVVIMQNIGYDDNSIENLFATAEILFAVD